MKPRENPLLVGLLVLYSAASFLHFAHNAEYLGDYPNLPAWLTPSGVYFAWAGLASLGVVGLELYHRSCHIVVGGCLGGCEANSPRKMALTVDRGR